MAGYIKPRETESEDTSQKLSATSQTEFTLSLHSVTDQNPQIHKNLKNLHETLAQFRAISHQIHTNSSNSSSNSIHRGKHKQDASKFNGISHGSQRFRVNLHHRTRTPAIRTRARHWKQRAASVIAEFKSEKKKKEK